MRSATLRALLAVPVVVYVLGRMIASGPSLSGSPVSLVGLILGVSVSVLPVLAVLGRVRSWWPYLPWLGGAVAVVVSTVWPSAPWSLTVPGAAVGLVLGSPLVLLAWVIRWRGSFVALVFNGTLALAVGTFDLAVVRLVGSSSATISAWWQSIRTVLSDQWIAVGDGRVDQSTAPLAYLPDGVFAGAALLLMMGLLISFLFGSERLVGVPSTYRPRGASGRPASGDADRLPALATRIVPPSAYLASGVASTIAALAAMILFEWSAATPEAPTLAGLAAGGIGLIFVLAVLSAPPRRVGAKPARPRPRASPERPRFRGLDLPRRLAAPPLPYPESALIDP